MQVHQQRTCLNYIAASSGNLPTPPTIRKKAEVLPTWVGSTHPMTLIIVLPSRGYRQSISAVAELINKAAYEIEMNNIISP